MKAFYKKWSPIGLAIACLYIAYLAYDRADYREQLYMVTPSIPLQPYCDEGGNHGDMRPIKGVELSDKFIHEMVKALSDWGATMHIEYTIKLPSGNLVPNPTPVLLSPETFEDAPIMFFSTRRALYETNDRRPDTVVINGRNTNVHPGIYNLICSDIEGKVTKF